MCGIAGIMCLQRKGCDIEANEILIKKMTDCIAHRGPDGEGQVVLDEGNIFLGHRRLAIIDLSEVAAQPMTSTDKRFTITYNGEVYNYKALRVELEGIGYRFFSQSDTEVVMNAYAEWGIDALKRFNGIFAFAIWDNYKKELILGRDRYGAKPLYYSRVGNQLLFASEYKAILLHPDFRKKLNLFALKEYFTFQNIFSNQTFLEDIKILEAGSILKVSYNEEELPEAYYYWDFDFSERDEKMSYEEYEKELHRLFVQAVNRQLVSDVPVGTYLSGGIDSGSITAVASKKITDLKTFTCGFDLRSASGMELSFDERERAEYMSYRFGTEHYEMVLKSGDMERCMKKLVWHLEDPRVGQSYPNFYASKLSSHFVKVVLAGSGGDEIFAGYPWRYYRTVGCKDFEDYIDSYYNYWQRILKHDEIKRFFAPIYSNMASYSVEQVFRDVFKSFQRFDVSPEQSINYSLYLEAKTFLHGLLIVEDKLSMAHGLETRVPFLDNDLVDFAMKMPIKYKLANLHEVVKHNENDYGKKTENYFQKTNDGKLILRNVMNRYIPSDITQAVKQGFSAPDASWFKGESIDYVRSIISNPNSKIYSYMNKPEVERMFDKHVAGVENKRLLIWSILNFEEWLKIFI